MPELPQGWEPRTLRDSALPGREGFIDGDWIESPYITDAGIRLIQTGNLGVGSFIDKPETRKYISAASYRILNCTSVNAGDILICRLADPIGRACEVPATVGEAVTAVDCTITRVDESRYDKSFLLHWLNSDHNLKAAADMAAGSTRSRISRSNLGRLPLPRPPLDQQAAIGRVLDTLDTTIRQTEAIIEKLKQVKQGLLHDLLTRGIDANGELRPPQSQAPHLYKDSPLGWIPKKWDFAPVGAMADIVYGISDAIEMGLDEGIRTITLPCVSASGDLSLASNSLVFTAPRKVPEALLLRRGDLLFNWRNGSLTHLGKTAYFNADGAYTHVGFLLRVRARAEVCLPEFLCAALRYAKDTGVFLRAKGQVNNTFNSDELRSLGLAFPGVDEQALICARLDALECVAVAERAMLSKLSVQKSGLMDDLLTGRVRVTSLLA